MNVWPQPILHLAAEFWRRGLSGPEVELELEALGHDYTAEQICRAASNHRDLFPAKTREQHRAAQSRGAKRAHREGRIALPAKRSSKGTGFAWAGRAAELWARGLPGEAIAAELGVAAHQLYNLASRNRDLFPKRYS